MDQRGLVDRARQGDHDAFADLARGALVVDGNGRRAYRIDAATGTRVGEPWSDLDWPVWQRTGGSSE